MSNKVLETFDITSFDTPISPEIQQKAIEALEQGKAVYFPNLPFILKSDELQFLSPQLVDPKSKNISYDVQKDKLGGYICSDMEAQKLKKMMHRYAVQSRSFMEKLFPGYVPHLDQARTSFRPVEIAGRTTSYRKDDKLLHVDSFPATPVKGKRIMRFFTNINANRQPRVWRLGEPFHQVVQKFGDQLKSPIPGLAWLLKTLRITKDYRTLYDHYMLQLHDTMKGSGEYQKNVEQHEILFPSGSTWIVFTDQASHAAMSGQHVMEQTYYLPADGLDNPETSPLRILERYYGKKMV
jgi:3-deoxy-D-manno-oct-2-ulosonic acid (Kdo) hydroxylase